MREGGGVEGRLEFFRKLIQFGSVTCPLVLVRNDPKTFLQTQGVPATGDLVCAPWFQQHSINQFLGHPVRCYDHIWNQSLIIRTGRQLTSWVERRLVRLTTVTVVTTILNVSLQLLSSFSPSFQFSTPCSSSESEKLNSKQKSSRLPNTGALLHLPPSQLHCRAGEI